MAKKKGISWFKLYITQLLMFETIAPEDIGNAFLSALSYLKGNDTSSELSQGARIVYTAFKNNIDDAMSDYDARVEDGRKGAAARRKKAQINELFEQYGGDEPTPSDPDDINNGFFS